MLEKSITFYIGMKNFIIIWRGWICFQKFFKRFCTLAL